MKATSAFDDFIPRISTIYDALGSCHSDLIPRRRCPGCQIGAESLFQELMRSWEWFLVEVLTDLIFGCHTSHITHPQSISRSIFPNRAAAHNELLRSRYEAGTGRVRLYPQPRAYILLHRPDMVIAVSEYWVPQNPISIEVQNNQSDILDLLTIRHGLSHGTSHAQNEMRSTLLRLDPANYYQTVGEFLLSRRTMTAPIWIDEFIDKVCRIAHRISP